MKLSRALSTLILFSGALHALLMKEIIFTPQEMQADFQKNELKADKKYNCSFIVKGKLKEVYRTAMSKNDYQVKLAGGVNIHFKDLDIESLEAKKIADLNVGDEIYVIADKAHYSMKTVYGDNGYAVKKELDENHKAPANSNFCINENVKLTTENESKETVSIPVKPTTEITQPSNIDSDSYYKMVDKKLNSVWSSLTKEQKDKILAEQRQWIKTKEKCTDTFCKTETTVDRIIQLSKYSVSSN